LSQTLKIRVLSDLHLNNKMWEAPAVPADLVVLAGDIANGTDGLRWARQAFPDQPIVYVAGNQEFYGHDMDALLLELRALAGELGIHFLERDVLQFSGVRILGATLWTDYDLFGFSARWMAIERSQRRRRPTDHKVIRAEKRVLTPNGKAKRHDAAVAWLESELARAFDGQTIVVTHHVPTIQGLPPAWRNDLSSAAFASNLDRLLPLADAWLCGHTHTASDQLIDGCRLVINPRGRTLNGLNGFRPELVIDV
jgi:predicted phosphodiesterase